VGRIGSLIGIGTLPLAGTAVAVASCVSAQAAAPAEAALVGLVRVDQVGYLPGDAKLAYLMTPRAVQDATFKVFDCAGHTVLSGSVGGTSGGSWNGTYPDVYPITFSGLTRSARYHIAVSGPVSRTSPDYVVGGPDQLHAGLVTEGVDVFQVQCDGAEVIPGALKRKPAHLRGGSASVYALPHLEPDGSDFVGDADLTKIGGPVNIEGGWFDAGDYLKFTHTTAYGDATLLLAERALGNAAPPTLDAEARYGMDWLEKVWDQSTRTLNSSAILGLALQLAFGAGAAHH
jgi:endoglucanase